MLRAIAAFLVLSGHAYILTGGNAPNLWGHGVQAIGVYLLFILGGYLIASSWANDRSIVRYSLKRITRIWPPLVAVVLISMFIVGPLVTQVPLEVYFSNFGVYANNILFKPYYSLPGVFIDNPYPNAVNGSLWTIPVELVFYILVPIIIEAMSRLNNDNFADGFIITLICIVVIVNYYLLVNGEQFIMYGTDWVAGFHLLPFYLMGIRYTRERVKKYLSLPVSLVLIFVLAAIDLPYAQMNVLLILVLPFLVFSFAFTPSKLKDFSKKYEITYGIYLYGFLIQHTIMHVFVLYNFTVNPFVFLILSVVLTIPLGLFSCICIEQPVRKITMKFIKEKCKPKANR